MSQDASTVRGLQLFFLRHADAGDPAEWTGDDSERPLSTEGRRQATGLGSHLRALGVTPDAVITSPRIRAADTARLVGEPLGCEATTETRLAGGFDADGLAGVLGQLDGSVRRVFLVGHDPDFSSLVSWLAGAPVSLGKGALARIDLPDRSLGPGRGSLRWLLPPDAILG